MKTSTPKENTNPKSKTETQAIPSTTPAPSTALPEGYLANGTMVDQNGRLLPEYRRDYPRQLANLIKPMDSTTFCTRFLEYAQWLARMDDLKYTQIYYDFTLNMALEAIEWVHKKKAPAVLRSIILAAIETVHDAVTYKAFYYHLEAIYICLLNDEEEEELEEELEKLLEEDDLQC